MARIILLDRDATPTRLSLRTATTRSSGQDPGGYCSSVCHDCPTPRSRLRGVMNELIADLLLPFVLYAIPIALLVAGGYHAL